jgi:hypothetical protein
MKTSNKILLGIFCTIILLSATINLMVYAKYKRGDAVPFVREESLVSSKLPTSKFVSVTALCNVEIRNSDTPRFEVRKGEEEYITYKMVGDTMAFQSKRSMSSEQLEHGECNNQLLILYLPVNTQAHFTQARVKIKGAEDSIQAPSFNIQLHKNSHLFMNGWEGNYKYINQLQLSGDESSFELHDRLVVKDMHLKLIDHCKFDGKRSAISSLTLDVDNSSFMSLSGFSIKNIK